MHRGSIFIITKNKEDNKFEVQKSIEFNGGMGLDCYGEAIYNMLKDLKEPLLFDAMIRDFDDRYFKCFEYSQTENQFKFFKDDNDGFFYTSDSNYIKNLSDENITIVCCNGNYILEPNQILIADYGECINNTRISFDKEIDKKIKIDALKTKEYIPTKKQKIILNNLEETFNNLDYNVNFIYENGMISGMEIETWTNGGVDMIHTFYFCDDFQDLYDVKNVEKQLKEIANDFSIDDEIDIYRQNKDYKENFTIRQSLEDFEEYKKRLTNLSKCFIDKYHELIYEGFLKNQLEMEEIEI